jgi:hypothetical protein
MLIVNKKTLDHESQLARALTSFLRGRQVFLLTLPAEEM